MHVPWYGIPSRHHYKVCKDPLFMFKHPCLSVLVFSWWYSSLLCLFLSRFLQTLGLYLLLDTELDHPKFFLDTLKATAIYFVERFIISASLFPQVKEQTHSSLLSPDYHSLAAAPCLSVAPSLLFLVTIFSPILIPHEDLCHHLLPLFLLSSSITVFSRPPPPPGHFPVRPASSAALWPNLWSTRCVWCFCVKHQNVLFLLLWQWHHPPICPRVYPVPESKPLLMSSKVWMKWTSVETPADF